MITYEALFALGTLIVSIIALILYIEDQKKK